MLFERLKTNVSGIFEITPPWQKDKDLAGPVRACYVLACLRACVRLMKLRPGAHLWRRVNAHCSFGRPCNCVRVRRKDASENSVEWVSQAQEKELLCGPSRLRGFPKRRKKVPYLFNEIFSSSILILSYLNIRRRRKKKRTEKKKRKERKKKSGERN